MTKNEMLLFKELCNIRSEGFDSSLIDYASPTVLGQLFYNRMQAAAYLNLKKHGLLSKVNREFRNALKGAYEQNKVKNESFYQCIKSLNKSLSGCKCKYAMLKGALLCKIYPEGCRTSNDIDLLVMPEDVTEIGKALLSSGFVQGNIRNDEFKPASRKEIIESRMTRGETIPYVKEVNLPGMRYLEVDINFSLDYKSGDKNALQKMLSRACTVRTDGLKIPSLDAPDFIIHLCAHLYKEAAALPWVEMKRDMSLYKYCDIYLLLSKMSDVNIDDVFERAADMGMEKMCAYAILQADAFFPMNRYAVSIAESILLSEPLFLHTVYSPSDKKTYIYTQTDVFERFFSKDRTKLLREVESDAST
jgi:hypothetical protein